MKTTFVRSTLIMVALTVIAISACDKSPAEIAATVEQMPASELAGLSATVEALPADQIAALKQAADSAGVPTLSAQQVTAVVGTVEAARATATQVGHMVAQGERVNATEMPDQAPTITYFFASAPDQAQAQSGIRYLLHWTTVNANRVEIFGHVMDNPQQGSWAVYNPSDNWTLWAANDVAWVERSMQVGPDKEVGSTLQNVTVDRTNITLTYRDPQLVDADQIGVDVNGARVLDGYVVTGRHVSFPVVLQSGANTVTVHAQNAGVTPPLVVEVTISNVTSGPSVQLSKGLNTGESQSFTITAP
jgi:hypothetical protein